jgi:hypothetical protein
MNELVSRFNELAHSYREACYVRENARLRLELYIRQNHTSLGISDISEAKMFAALEAGFEVRLVGSDA